MVSLCSTLSNRPFAVRMLCPGHLNNVMRIYFLLITICCCKYTIKSASQCSNLMLQIRMRNVPARPHHNHHVKYYSWSAQTKQTMEIPHKLSLNIIKYLLNLLTSSALNPCSISCTMHSFKSQSYSLPLAVFILYNYLFKL